MASVTRVYILMLGVFAAGIYLILSIGSIYLSAPRDLSGQWELRTIEDPADAPPAHTLLLDQSGWYYRIVIDGDRQRPFDLKRQTPPHDPNIPNDQISYNLAGPGLDLTLLQSTARRDEFLLNIKGAIEGTWTALRIDPARASRAASRGGTTRPQTSQGSH